MFRFTALEVPRVTMSNVCVCVCYLAFTDDHQSTAAVLCPAVQELPLLLREGEDSEYCCVATLLPLHSELISELQREF